MTKTNSIKIADNFYLCQQDVNNPEIKGCCVPPTNHIFVCDVSGSMYSELPIIRTHLKNKLSSIMNDRDTITIIWFSGKDESGILKEEVEVKSLKDLNSLHQAIDRWLMPLGLTDFLKPLQLTKEAITRISRNRPGTVFNLFFLSDGYNNNCSYQDVLKELKELENLISSSVFIEYGYYADSKRLSEMARTIGGEKISCSGFEDYEPVFNEKISKGSVGKKVRVELELNHAYEWVYAVTNDSVVVYNIGRDNSVMIPEDVETIYYFNNDGRTYYDIYSDKVIYAGIYICADNLMTEEVEKLLAFIGDKYYYNMFVNCYGKQKLNVFKSEIRDCIGDKSKRFLIGRGQIEAVDDNQYCLLDLFRDLIDNNAVFYPGHEDFVYNRIGRKKIRASGVLTENDKELLSRCKDIESVNKVMENKKSIKFVDDDHSKAYQMHDMVWNEKRANLSIRIVIDGHVELPENNYNLSTIKSYRYNTYTFIRDGIVNIEKLPVQYSDELIDILCDNEVEYFHDYHKNMIIIDLTSLPLINRSMVMHNISAKKLAELEWNLVKTQADKKVYDYFKKQLFHRTSQGFVEKYGVECTEWLSGLGVTDYGGYSPKTISAESVDSYMSLVMETKIKSFNSFPKVIDVENKLSSGKKLTPSESIMVDAITNYKKQTESDLFKTLSEEKRKEILEAYLANKTKDLDVCRRKLLHEIAEIKFALILSRRWFMEFKNFDENKLTLEFDDRVLDFTFDLQEKEEKI